MEPIEAAQAFKALGDPTRLQIMTCLIACNEEVTLTDDGELIRKEGLTAGQVCCQVSGIDKVTSTMSFHLKELRQAGLIEMHKDGRSMLCRVNPAKIEELRGVLQPCCPECSCH